MDLATLLVVAILILLISLIVFININNKLNKQISHLNSEIKSKDNLNIEQIHSYYGKEWDKELQNFETKTNNLNKEFNNKFVLLNEKLENISDLLKEKEKRYDEVNQDLTLYKEGKIKEIDGTAAEYEKHQQTIISNALEDYRAYWTDKFNEELAKMAETRNLKLEELTQLDSELEEERSKRQAINEEILRQRALDEQQDFYRIQISEEDKRDIDILKDIVPRLRRPDAVSKIIWTNYYQKPLAELRNRVAIEGPGVYKITRIKTGEIYIGQAVNVSTRWTEHCKTALGIGSLASSQLHRVMKEDGCENFTFELLEEVPKEKLRERESYYIDFYDSKKYGLNTISGDKNK